MMAVAVSFGEGFSSAAPRTLFRGDFEELGRPDWPRNYDAAADGKTFFLIKPDPGGYPAQVRAVLNWFAELDGLIKKGPGRSQAP
jgi:hypothetical protein